MFVPDGDVVVLRLLSEEEVAAIQAATDSESGDAQYNLDVWELRRRVNVLLAERRLLVARSARMDRIADEHVQRSGPGGLVDGNCQECLLPDPCPTHEWARWDSDRDPLVSCWDRADEDGDDD